MDLEDLEPKKKKAYELGQDLSKLSVGELAELVETLKARLPGWKLRARRNNPR